MPAQRLVVVLALAVVAPAPVMLSPVVRPAGPMMMQAARPTMTNDRVIAQPARGPGNDGWQEHRDSNGHSEHHSHRSTAPFVLGDLPARTDHPLVGLPTSV
jgi:hypothetical protein